MNLPVSHQQSELRALRLALAIYILLFILKLVAYFLTSLTPKRVPQE